MTCRSVNVVMKRMWIAFRLDFARARNIRLYGQPIPAPKTNTVKVRWFGPLEITHRRHEIGGW